MMRHERQVDRGLSARDAALLADAEVDFSSIGVAEFAPSELPDAAFVLPDGDALIDPLEAMLAAEALLDGSWVNSHDVADDDARPMWAESQRSRADALVADVVETRAGIARLQARELQTQVALVEHVQADAVARRAAGMPASETAMAHRSAACEIAAATRQSDHTVEDHLVDALTLSKCFPKTYAAFSTGEIDLAHVRHIIGQGTALSGAAQDRYDEQVVDIARWTTPATTKHRAERLAQQLQPRTIDERHRDTRELRDVNLRPCADGMTTLEIYAPTILLTGVYERITQIACTAKHLANDPDDERTMDQRRTDTALDLLLASIPSPAVGVAHGELDHITATVHMTIPAFAFTRQAGGAMLPELDGRAPITMEQATELLATSDVITRVMTSPCSGEILAVDDCTPSKALRRRLRARDQHCRFPGCRAPVWHCDADHTCPHSEGGPTCLLNMAHLCRRHHMLKHNSEWKVRQLGRGILEWTSPAGRLYVDQPEPRGPTFVDAWEQPAQQLPPVDRPF